MAVKPEAKGQPDEARERLLVEAAQMDPARFSDLYELYFERVYCFVARRVDHRDVAEDITSDVFHKALANLPRFKWRGAPFAAWLFRIAANVIADRAKRSARESASAVDEATSLATEMPTDDLVQQAHLFRLVSALPADQRRVIVMRFVDEKSIREIAGELGRTEGAIKQLQFRGLQTLRQQLGETNG